MKKIKYLIFISVVIVLSACKKTVYTPPDIKVPDIIIPTPEYEDMLQALRSGGQPGQISINGAAVQPDGTLDARITIEQIAGKSSDSKRVEIAPSQLPKLSSDLKRKDDYQPGQFGTYLNVGCDLQDDVRIEGLTELKNKPDEHGFTDVFGTAGSKVDKVFICGKIKTTERHHSVMISANEVILDQAELTVQRDVGHFIVITADVLSIEGKNLILTQGDSDSMPAFFMAPSITLNVFDRVMGTGDLKLMSIGGDYVPKKTE